MAAKQLTLSLCLAGNLLLAGPARADIVVIANLESPVHALTPNQVSDLYLGRLRSLPDGTPVSVIEQEHDSQVRERFFRQLNNMSLKQLNAYWARLQFSGQVLPPTRLKDGKEIIRAVRSNRLTIGYVDSAEVDDSVRTLLRLKEAP